MYGVNVMVLWELLTARCNTLVVVPVWLEADVARRWKGEKTVGWVHLPLLSGGTWPAMIVGSQAETTLPPLATAFVVSVSYLSLVLVPRRHGVDCEAGREGRDEALFHLGEIRLG